MTYNWQRANDLLEEWGEKRRARLLSSSFLIYEHTMKVLYFWFAHPRGRVEQKYRLPGRSKVLHTVRLTFGGSKGRLRPSTAVPVPVPVAASAVMCSSGSR